MKEGFVHWPLWNFAATHCSKPWLSSRLRDQGHRHLTGPKPRFSQASSEAGFAANKIRRLLGFGNRLKRKLMNEHSLQCLDGTKILWRYLTLRNGQIEFGLYTEH